MRLRHHPRVAPGLIGKQLGRFSQTDSHFGIKPLRLPSLRLWPIDSITTPIEERQQ